MSQLFFAPSNGLLRFQQCEKARNTTVRRRTGKTLPIALRNSSIASASQHRTSVAIPHTRTKVQSMRIVVLTDFSSNPFLAVRDRVADPLSALLIAVAALMGGTVSWFMKAKGAISSRPVSKLDENAQEMSASDSAAQEVYQLRDNDSINITKLPSPARMTAVV